MVAKDPRTDQEIYNSLKSSLQGKIASLTNFSTSSFNYIFTNAFATEQHEQEVAATATQLSGWVDYVGKDLDQSDLNDLGIDGATPSELNEFQDSSHLDEFAKAFGITRDSGTKASGTLEITFTSDVTVETGTTFGTQPDNDGEFLAFETTADVEPPDAGSFPKTNTVNIEAVEVGDEFNVNSGTITYLPSPPIGVSSVTNTTATTGGADEQSDEDFREDIKEAVVSSANGGTVNGVQTYIEDNTGATSAIVQEKFTGDAEHGSYPHADVVVNGGGDTEVEDAIDFAHPSGVEHILVRPTEITVDVTVDLIGSDIDTGAVETTINNFFGSLDINENVYRDQLIQQIMNTDSDIDNIDSLEITILDEEHTFNTGTDVYILNKTLQTDDSDSDGIVEVTGTLSSSNHTFVEDTDYQEWNSGAGDTSEPHDAIDWSLGGDDPDDTTSFFVDYNVKEDITIDATEVAELNSSTVTVV